ncbi:MAG: GxxExxY protein [Bacteroidota bacterium]|nr:GxxExxY protein [Bacteroidota bacterium]
MKATLERKDLLYPELSYRIVGCAFDVFKEIGPGHLEKTYQRALALSFRQAGISFTEQVRYDVKFHNEKAGYGFCDFLVEDKIIVELKRGKSFVNKEVDQVIDYLKKSNLQLGLIIRFTHEGARCKRLINLPPIDVK